MPAPPPSPETSSPSSPSYLRQDMSHAQGSFPVRPRMGRRHSDFDDFVAVDPGCEVGLPINRDGSLALDLGIGKEAIRRMWCRVPA